MMSHEYSHEYKGYTVEKRIPPRRGIRWRFYKAGAGRPGYARNLEEVYRSIDFREKETEEYQASRNEAGE